MCMPGLLCTIVVPFTEGPAGSRPHTGAGPAAPGPRRRPVPPASARASQRTPLRSHGSRNASGYSGPGVLPAESPDCPAAIM
jgi:hypothetical protein